MKHECEGTCRWPDTVDRMAYKIRINLEFDTEPDEVDVIEYLYHMLDDAVDPASTGVLHYELEGPLIKFKIGDNKR